MFPIKLKATRNKPSLQKILFEVPVYTFMQAVLIGKGPSSYHGFYKDEQDQNNLGFGKKLKNKKNKVIIDSIFFIDIRP